MEHYNISEFAEKLEKFLKEQGCRPASSIILFYDNSKNEPWRFKIESSSQHITLSPTFLPKTLEERTHELRDECTRRLVALCRDHSCQGGSCKICRTLHMNQRGLLRIEVDGKSLPPINQYPLEKLEEDE